MPEKPEADYVRFRLTVTLSGKSAELAQGTLYACARRFKNVLLTATDYEDRGDHWTYLRRRTVYRGPRR